jgi:hypothetical protein
VAVTGRSLAAVLAAGGEGAWISTPLLATPEAIEVSETYKKCIVESDGQDTVVTTVYDIMYDLRFPDGIAGGARINQFTREWHGRESEVRQRREELAARAPLRPPLERDPDVHPIWMGPSAGSRLTWLTKMGGLPQCPLAGANFGWQRNQSPQVRLFIFSSLRPAANPPSVLGKAPRPLHAYG